MLQLRPMRPTDMPYLVRMAEACATEAPNYQHVPFSRDAFQEYLAMCWQREDCQCWVALKDGCIIGSFAASVSEMTMSRAKVAIDSWLYIAPEHRRSMATRRIVGGFLELYKTWCAIEQDNVATVLMGVSTGINAERTTALLKRLGCEDYGSILRVA